MGLSQKCQYALRALFELAKRHGQGSARVADIAEAQAIPPRFLELILGELKRPGWVESRRWATGGYVLSAEPEGISVGEIIRFIEGPLNPVTCLGGDGEQNCPLQGQCAFMDLWARAQAAVTDVYDSTTLADLITQERSAKYALSYCI
jgi:Rrf2 family protein